MSKVKEKMDILKIADSDHGINTTGNTLVHTPQKNSSLCSSGLPEEIQDEIDDLYDNIPEVRDLFQIVDKIGEGTFSSVFLARLRDYPDSQPYALKHIIPTSHPSRIEQELSCLQEIGGVDNVMGVELCLRKKDHVVIVMPYFPHDKFQDYVQCLHLEEVRDYMKNLLLALRRVHQFNIIHRDVKPSNFLFNRLTKQFALVDFGLAHKAPVKKAVNCEDRAVTRIVSKPGQPLTPINNQITDKSTPTSSQSKPGITKPYYQTPPTPEMGNLADMRKKKSPRRSLLARRMLLVNNKAGEVKKAESSVQSRRLRSCMENLSVTCQCYGQTRVCSICTSRSNQVAPRAGTPGFRSPEVLMKCPDQSTAVDIWSAGVIFLSLLSGRYPFFRANDDLTALAQIISIMGSDEVKEAAKAYGKMLTCNPSIPKLDIRKMCEKLRHVSKDSKHRGRRQSDISEQENHPPEMSFPETAFDLLLRLLDLNPNSRVTASDALLHPFFTGDAKS